MVIKTLGLPDGQGNPHQIYEFSIHRLFIYIPGAYGGIDMIGEPYFPEQKEWLNHLAPNISIKEVWCGTFECATYEDLNKVIATLETVKIKEE